MKIMIEIPQKVIEKDAEGYFNYFGCMSKTLYETLKNGTVLPEQHGDLIDRNELLKNDSKITVFIESDIRNAPTILEGTVNE